MISVSGREWQESKFNKNLAEKTQQDYNFSKILSQLIVSRNFTKNEIHLIENNLHLSNVFQNNRDFIKSVILLENVIKNKEKICILGDYDVDGSASTSLFVKFFESINHPYFYYIPDREKDGYGASKKLFEKLIKKKPKLIIMVDCGSTSVEAIDYLNEKKVKSLVIDHHEMTKPFPKANIIINPKKDNGYIKYDYLCATTLTYFFLDMLVKKIQSKLNLRKYLIYVLLATVCDVMPLRKLNRLIAKNVFKEFDLNENYAFNEIYKLSNKKNKINIDDLGYLVGPILNSGGRLGKSNYATKLLSSENHQLINQKALDLITLNNKRKKIESISLENIDFDKIESENKDIIFHYDPNINEGLLGIIAARLKDYFNKPTIIITNSNELLKSSARSTHNYNIGRAIRNSLTKNLILNGGGHSMAAGFTLKKENLLDFREFIFNDFLKKRTSTNSLFVYDAQISSSAFNKVFFNDINQISPFGNGNPLPIFLFKDLKVIKSTILKKKYISCILKPKTGSSINSIFFNSIDSKIGVNLLNYKKYFSVIGQINENFWNNKKTLQLIIKDLIL
jgi:single-stranded-DNA-specific exonuclease